MCLFRYMQYKHWQDCRNMELNCCEMCLSSSRCCIRGFSALHQQPPAPTFDGQFTLYWMYSHSCICVCAGLFSGQITALSSFPTSINVSHFLDPLTVLCTCMQLQAETIIKEEFKMVLSSKLLCLRRGWFYVYSLSVQHLQWAVKSYFLSMGGGGDNGFCCRWLLRKMLVSRDFCW